MQGHTMQGHSERFAQAVAHALRWLRYRDYSSQELEQRLQRRGYTAEEIEETLAWLRAEGYLSDERLAARLIERYTAEQPSGQRRIEQIFTQRGLAVPALEEDEETRAVRALQQRFGEPPPTADPRQVARWFRFLLQRGFEAETAQSALRRWNPHIKEEL
ncbi:MAG: recombination regulator RecX [Fimbriimonadales bacterium]|nr:recombination regulator RecX [Fimbriimonadales bacterium]MDW8051720.1 regulatory protein RecX [Armatimonadota bacterium]